MWKNPSPLPFGAAKKKEGCQRTSYCIKALFLLQISAEEIIVKGQYTGRKSWSPTSLLKEVTAGW